jgi:hypothetical protein
MRSLGLPVPEAENIGELMTKLEQMSKDGPIDMRQPAPSASASEIDASPDQRPEGRGKGEA